MQSRDPYQGFYELYQTLNADADIPTLLANLYHPDIHFSDPFHAISGLTTLTQYFKHLYQDVAHIRFEFHQTLVEGEQGCVHWTMYYRHPKLYKGEQDIPVEGMSLLKWQEGKIIKHQDFFDGGAMLYEHIPLLGWGVRKIKERIK